MKPFGHTSMSYRYGYDLSMCLGHLEGLLDEETEQCSTRRNALRLERLHLVEEAVQKLNQALDIGGES